MEDRGEAETIQFANSLCYKDTDSQSMLQGHRLTVYATEEGLSGNLWSS